jgi:hypothetical protein
MKIARVLTLIGLFSLLANSQSKAQLLTLQPAQVNGQPAPDFTANNLTVSYAASTTIFQATGYYYDDSNYDNLYTDASGNENPNDPFAADFNLTAYITSAGILTSGTLTIAGDLVGDSVYTTLLTGTLQTGAEGTAFGATSGTDAPFQFLFTVTGGSLANDYGGVGASHGYVNYLEPDGGYTFSGSWTANFANSGNGYADVQMAVPEPSSFVLLMFAGALCAAANMLRRPSRRDA